MADQPDDYEKFVKKSIAKEIKTKKLSHRTPGPLDTIHAADEPDRVRFKKGGMVKGHEKGDTAAHERSESARLERKEDRTGREYAKGGKVK